MNIPQNIDKGRISLVKANGVSYIVPFVLVTSLFFLWGFAHSLLDLLNKHFQEILGITKAESGLVQSALYGGYLIMAIPAGLFMNKYGYKKGIILGLLLYAIGAFFFYPASLLQTFSSFLLGLFIIACGLTFLETAANPYTTVLGPKKSAAQRINLAQSFNGLGWVLGPMVGGLIIFGGRQDGNHFSSLAIPYVAIGFVVLLVAVLFFFTSLPEIKEEVSTESLHTQIEKEHLYQYRHFKFAAITQFLYVAAQTGINSFFINYVTESIHGISNQTAALILSFGGMGLFFIGRLSGSYILKFVKPNRLIAVYAGIAVFLMALVIAGLGWISIAALIAVFFFESIMFPTIFALGIRDLGIHTKKASSYIVMGVAGGAICPIIMGGIADVTGSMAIGFTIPLGCFIFVCFFGIFGYKVK